MIARDITHRDRRSDAGTETARGDAPDRLSGNVDDLGARARGRAAQQPQAHALARRTVGERRQDARGSGKAALGAPALRDRPCEPRLDRIGRLVEFVAVEAEAGLQPQRVARAEADRLDLALRQQPARERHGVFGGQRNLKTVLAGVAGARDRHVEPVEGERLRTHERHRLDARSRREAREDARGRRSLQRDERGVVGDGEDDIRGQGGAQSREIRRFTLGVDHQRDTPVRAGRTGRHQVVDDAAVGVEQLGVALPPGREPDDVGGGEVLQRACGRLVIGAVEKGLAHVGDVEQAGEGARVQVFGENAAPILDRHFVACERREARAEFDVQRVERGPQGYDIRHRSPRLEQANADIRSRRATASRRRPLCPVT